MQEDRPNTGRSAQAGDGDAAGRRAGVATAQARVRGAGDAGGEKGPAAAAGNSKGELLSNVGGNRISM